MRLGRGVVACSAVLFISNMTDERRRCIKEKIALSAIRLIQEQFFDCDLVKRGRSMSFRERRSLQGRVVHLMMVFSGGLSPLCFANCVSIATFQPFLRD